MSFKAVFSVLLVCCTASAFAQVSNVTIPLNITIPSNVTIPGLIPASPLFTYSTAVAICPLRDQILRLNMLLSIENVNLAFFQQLQSRLSNVSSTANVGLPAGASIVELRGNLSTIISQITTITSFLNSTITSGCSFLPADQDYCYVWAPCNYTFGNLTALSNSSSSSISNSTVAAGNSTASNSTTGANSTRTNSTFAPSATAMRTTLSQGWYMCDQSVNYISSTVLLLYNTTLQLQLMEFQAVHAQQSTYLRLLSEQQPFITPAVFSSSSSLGQYARTNIAARYANFIADRACCDGFRGVKPASS